MAGADDPSNFLLPQQAVHPCMLPHSSQLATLNLCTNPYCCDVDGARFERRVGRITPRVFETVSAYLGLARDWHIDPVHMALAWHRTRPFVSIPIIGATISKQLAHQLPAMDLALDPALDLALHHFGSISWPGLG